MGCSWYTYAGTLKNIKKGWILIPEYAQDWAGTDKLEVARAGSYDDFKMDEIPHDDKTLNYLNGDLLIGVFKKLYKGEQVDVALEDCYYKEYGFPYNDETLENLRCDGIYSDASRSCMPYSLKVTDDPSLTYETCKYYSPASQAWYPEKDHFAYEELYDQKEYDKEWNYYFGNVK